VIYKNIQASTSERMRQPKPYKIELLKMIKEKKLILFGNFTDELENKMKNDAWDEVVVKAKSLQLIREDRDADFVRDKLYGQWKSRALVI
jgi:hypothetical protein